tara:strand:- start:112 stop:1170 length:1059 start_codon:yes stop_codon:yes gene_type:complete
VFPEDKFLFLILLIENLINIVDISFAYHGILKFRIILLVSLLPKLISAGLILSFVVDEGLGHLYLFLLSSVSFAAYAIFLIFQQSFQFVRFKFIQLSYIVKSINYFMMNLLTTFEQSYDRLIIGFTTLHYSQLGFYDIALKVVMLFCSFVVSISNVVMPMLARDEHGIETQSYSARLLLIIILIATSFGILMGEVLPNYLTTLFGQSYSEAALYFDIFSVLVITKSVGIFVLQTFLVVQNKVKNANKLSVLCVMPALPLYFYLSYVHGIMYVAVAVCFIDFIKATSLVIISNIKCKFRIIFIFWLAITLLFSFEYLSERWLLGIGNDGILLLKFIFLGIPFLLLVYKTFRKL